MRSNINVRQGDVITAELLNRLANQQMAAGIRTSGGISSRQNPDGATQIWGNPSDGIFLCQPTSAVAGATGTWPDLTPTDFNADVYLLLGDKLTLVLSSADCTNWHAGALVANKTCTLIKDPSGKYIVIDQDC
jgi:hypothetical protein